ncbi:DNA-binding response regulator, OmpR family, contains REC and winged-helix (wHTH) domain [Methylophilus rhizosphaerae]|uniref:DNA-binding response regulator, OmpR family, contains REC and winged-helix (WHTH) domain n=1 Tax=Methylophilus rhizosphaerae TaxID=492660 RepID=A0A1G9BBB2_9PROT|nr:response regulator transcription factor [Methylophilus rhizosphaerae]SDK36856.1 DNA-binding response regulator, OmpR family, contains REC and winged-helix (wHTH) domain [Methylophilus rhizosphaerae]
MRLLLVEDEVGLGAGIQQALKIAGYACDWAQDGAEASIQGGLEPYDLAIVDLGLPGLPGLDVLAAWRAKGVGMPVIVLTARSSWQEKVEAFNLGADDYVTKPFHMQELLARISAVHKRTVGLVSGELASEGLRLDEHTQTVWLGTASFALTGTEFRLLRYFMLHPGRIFSKTELTEHVYAYDADKDSNVIEVYINRLRHKIGADRIQTRRGQGYVFGGAVERPEV